MTCVVEMASCDVTRNPVFTKIGTGGESTARFLPQKF
jgi:hypothetical protein